MYDSEMMTDSIVLHGDSRRESPYVFSSFVALREKGIPFELRTMSLHDGEHRLGEYPARSMTGRVPALQHGDFWLAESSAIDEYLEDAFPPPRWPRIYPAGVRERALARQVQAWLRSDLPAIRDERDVATVFGAPATTPLSSVARAEVERLATACERILSPGERFLFGEFSIADVDLALMLQRLLRSGDALPERPRAYAEEIWRRPAIREWVDHPRPAARSG